ncbi:hypothetical protein LINPERHAP2_LOCUS22957 [Linum perenne]
MIFESDAHVLESWLMPLGVIMTM